MDTIAYLDAIKAARGIASDYATARALRVSPQQVSKWRRRVDVPSPLIAYRIADILGTDPARVVADLERERAERAGRTDDADTWGRWIERLAGATVAAVVGAVAIGPAPSQGSTVEARIDRAESVYYVNRHRRLRRLRAWIRAAVSVTQVTPPTLHAA